MQDEKRAFDYLPYVSDDEISAEILNASKLLKKYFDNLDAKNMDIQNVYSIGCVFSRLAMWLATRDIRTAP